MAENKKEIEMIINLTKEEWIEVIKLVDERADDGFTNRNKYNDLKDKMLFQFGFQNNERRIR